MIAKAFEILDRATCIPMLAVKLEPSNVADRYVLARAGFGTTPHQQSEYIQLIEIAGGGGRTACDPHEWGDRTKHVAHKHIIENFDKLESGAVIDVEFILGESTTPKPSEREEDR